MVSLLTFVLGSWHMVSIALYTRYTANERASSAPIKLLRLLDMAMYKNILSVRELCWYFKTYFVVDGIKKKTPMPLVRK